MAVITAADSLAGLAGYVNACISSALRSFAVDYWPAHQADIGTGPSLTMTRIAAAAHCRMIAAADARSYKDDYYYRVHLVPQILALGNLLSTQTRPVDVWNAYPDQSLTLNAVLPTNADGITATPPTALPLTFTPLQLRTWQVAINITGSAVVNASLTWQFAGAADDVTLSITGNRVIPWTVPPDWGAAGVTEEFAWLTDVMIAPAGPEQRRQLRLAPRRTFDFDAWLSAQTRRIMEAQLFQWAAQVWALPIWSDATVLPAAVSPGALSIAFDTTELDYVDGGQAILLASTTTYEIVQIATVTAGALLLSQPVGQSWPSGSARIYPMRTARLTAFPQLTRSTDDRSSITPSFLIIEPCDWAASFGGATYRALPVLEVRPNEVQDPTATYSRLIVTTDSGTGVLAVDDTAGMGQPMMGHRFLLAGKSARAAHRALLYALAGRLNTIWVPSWNQDLKMTGPAPVGASTLLVEWTGYSRFLLGQLGRQDIRIELLNGTIRYRRITGAIELDANTEQLALDTALDVALQPAAIRAISYLTPCRLDSDKVRVIHEHDAAGSAESDVSWRADLHVV